MRTGPSRSLAGEIRQQLIFPSGKLPEKLRRLGEIDRHYLKKENLFFPYMEQYGITAPPKVMWGVDDEIRDKLKAVAVEAADAPGLREKVEALLAAFRRWCSRKRTSCCRCSLRT